MTASLPVAIIGAGPVGLAAAAHLLECGETPVVLEAGTAVGHAVRQWSHVRMFSPWAFNCDAAAVRMLDAAGWQKPDGETIPTGGELVARYLEPLAELPAMRSQIRLDTRVAAVGRKGMDKVRTEGRAVQPFVLRTVANGRDTRIEAKAVIDASGTWTSPNPAGADGWAAIGEREAAERIAYGIPDVLGREKARYADRTVLVLGSGHSALNALIELAALKQEHPGTRVVWALRKPRIEGAYGGESADGLPARGALGSQVRMIVETGQVEAVPDFRLSRIDRSADGGLVAVGEGGCCSRHIEADEMIVATGFRPDHGHLRELRLTIDPWLESAGTIGPLIDPNLHSCGTVRPHGAAELAHPEPGFYIAGMKSYGRAPTFLLATGHEQVRSIAASLTGDHEAAARVELTLPETGVCSARPITALADAGCCGPAPASAAACCGPAPVEIQAPSGCCPAPRAS